MGLEDGVKSDIQEEAYSELCEENARLRAIIEELSDHSSAADRMRLLKEQNAELERLRALSARAAEALEFWMKDLAATEQQYVDAALRDERLLAELRKAV